MTAKPVKKQVAPKRLSREKALEILSAYAACLQLLYNVAEVQVPVDLFNPANEANRLIEGIATKLQQVPDASESKSE